MKFDIKFLDEAYKEFNSLSEEQKELLKGDYLTIKNDSIERVLTRPLGNKIFEIKTSNLRSLYKYQENQIIIIGVIYVKKTKKTPKEILKLAQKRLKNM